MGDLSPVIFWPLVFSFIYMFIISIPAVKAFLSEGKPKKICRLFRRTVWSAVLLFFFCFFFVEDFFAACQLNSFNRRENTPPRPIEITRTERDLKNGNIVVWYTYKDTGEKDIFRAWSLISDVLG